MARYPGVSTSKCRLGGRGTLINIGREIGLIPLLIDTRIVIELPGVKVMRPGRRKSGMTLNESRDVVVVAEAVCRVHKLLPDDG
jgi:hypothetical protein